MKRCRADGIVRRITPDSVVCVGDSNMVLAASALLNALDKRGMHCPVTFLTRLGKGIDGWGDIPCGELYVVNLGINDALDYEDWLERARTFRSLLDGPVVWSNLPWEIEPAARRQGCLAVNAALEMLDVTVADWASEANPHPGWIEDAHLTTDGAKAWARCVLNATESRPLGPGLRSARR